MHIIFLSPNPHNMISMCENIKNALKLAFFIYFMKSLFGDIKQETGVYSENNVQQKNVNCQNKLKSGATNNYNFVLALMALRRLYPMTCPNLIWYML